MRHLIGWWSALAVCLVACGVDVQGLGPGSGRDSGAAADGSVVNTSGVARNDGGGASSSVAGNDGGGASSSATGTVATDGAGAGTLVMEGGAASNGPDAGQTDAVAPVA